MFSQYTLEALLSSSLIWLDKSRTWRYIDELAIFLKIAWKIIEQRVRVEDEGVVCSVDGVLFFLSSVGFGFM